MTAQILSERSMQEVLSALDAGHTIAEAMASVGGTEHAFWTWKRKSAKAERDLDFGSYYLSWNGHLDHFHVLAAIAQKPKRAPLPLPPYHRSLNTPAPTEPTYNGSPFPPTPTPSSPRVVSPLVADLRERLKQKPQHPYPVDVHGNRMIARLTAGSTVNDPEERVTGASYE
jgi:hypothetical protein